MDVNQLRYFRAVAETLNFTHAASFLYMSQTTLSYQISALEKELGVLLFDRKRGGVELTPSGAKLFELAPRLIMQIDEAVRATVYAAEGVDSTFRIGFLGRHEQHFLPTLVSTFSESHPDVDVIMKQGAPDSLVTQLKNGTLDFIFMLSTDREQHKDLEISYFERIPFYAIMKKDNPLASVERLERKDLVGQKLCFLSSSSSSRMNSHFLESFKTLGHNDGLIDTSASMESLMVLIEAKGYVTVCPKCMMSHSKALVAVPMKGADEFIFHGAAWRAGDKNPLIADFINMGKALLEHNISLGCQFPD